MADKENTHPRNFEDGHRGTIRNVRWDGEGRGASNPLLDQDLPEPQLDHEDYPELKY